METCHYCGKFILAARYDIGPFLRDAHGPEKAKTFEPLAFCQRVCRRIWLQEKGGLEAIHNGQIPRRTSKEPEPVPAETHEAPVPKKRGRPRKEAPKI